jgi:hypothetical protein
LAFRGPRRDLRSDYIAFIGGTETYGKFVEAPFPQLVETETGLTCVNLGWPNAGIDVLLGDPGLARIAAGAQIAVVQVPCAANLSNRFYRVHARRNDRFLQATELLRRLYPEVDFTEFSFTRHMLLRLRATSPERFALVHAELSAVWTEGMKRLIGEIGRPVVLLWFSGRRPEWQCDNPDMAHEPALVSRGMLDALKRRAAALVEVDSGAGGQAADDRGLVVSRQDLQAARELPGQPAHEVAAQALVPVIAELLDP